MEEEFENSLNSIQEKIGKETSGMIADELAKLISYNSAMVNTQKSQNAQIEKLKKEKENLITANGNLLQQVAMSEESVLKPNNVQNEPEKPFSFKACMDEKGNFI